MLDVTFDGELQVTIKFKGAELGEVDSASREEIERHIRNDVADFVNYSNMGSEEWQVNKLVVDNIEEVKD